MKIAVVSGASSGMGREAVRQIADRFEKLDEIWVTARRGELLQALAKEFPGRIRVFPGDLTDGRVIEGIEAAVKEAGARVMLLVNAAGYGKLGKAGQISARHTEGMVRLNCASLSLLTEALLPYMPRHARIINFASAAAFLPQPGFAVYAATKAYVLSYSMALGKELSGRGITVTAVCPGPVDTEFFTTAEENAETPWYKKYFMAETEKVVSKALFDAFRGRAVSVYGLPVKALQAVTKVLPQGLILKLFDL